MWKESQLNLHRPLRSGLGTRTAGGTGPHAATALLLRVLCTCTLLTVTGQHRSAQVLFVYGRMTHKAPWSLSRCRLLIPPPNWTQSVTFPLTRPLISPWQVTGTNSGVSLLFRLEWWVYIWILSRTARNSDDISTYRHYSIDNDEGHTHPSKDR